MYHSVQYWAWQNKFWQWNKAHFMESLYKLFFMHFSTFYGKPLETIFYAFHPFITWVFLYSVPKLHPLSAHY